MDSPENINVNVKENIFLNKLLPVLFHVSFLREGLSAEVTTVRFVSRMHPQMGFQVRSLGKPAIIDIDETNRKLAECHDNLPFAAELTTMDVSEVIWILVLANVSFQLLSIGQIFGTDNALEVLPVFVHFNVAIDKEAHTEELAADLAAATWYTLLHDIMVDNK